MEVGRLEERRGAESVEAAVQDEWTGIEERKKFGVGYQLIVTSAEYGVGSG